MLRPLGKPEPRVDDDLCSLDPRTHRHGHLVREFTRDLAADVAVLGGLIHLAGASTGMHQHERSAPRGDHLRQLWVIQQSGHIVHHRGTQIEGDTRNIRLVCIDRHRHPDCAHEATQHRRHPRQFLVGRQRRGARPR